MADRLSEILEKSFGHRQFRRPQREIVESVLSGADTLAIMPTGGGKSLCYQLPAVLSEGVALVVSPLIALMKDQVDALAARGIPAAMINSAQSPEERRLALARLRLGSLKLAYIAPERFRMRSFARSLEGVKISLFAVDEAHCISQWGHDFRPDYARLGEAVEALGRPPVAAFTATATPEVRQDIVAQLNMRNPKVFVSGFARPNLSFNVTEVSGKAEKEMRVREIIAKHKVGIVYCATRKSAQSLSEALWDDGVRHVVYHGGMSVAERDAAQEAFVGGRENVAVATNAFGMGIDRPDIRFVCHYELPGSVEAYYQEAGRAGRDGNPAYCEMLMMYSDKRVQEFFIDGANPEPDFIRAVYAAIRSNSDEGGECVMPADDIAECAAAKLRAARSAGRARRFSRGGTSAAAAQNSMAVSSAISILRRLGILERFDIPGMRSRGTRLLMPDLAASELDLPAEKLREKRRRDENKLRDMISFAYSRACRQEWILGYFGEADASACGVCDNCRRAANPAPSASRPLDLQEIEIARKALSCVARMSRRTGPRTWTPIFGRTLVLDCLLGSRNERILRFGFDSIPTHGALKSLGKKFVSALISALESEGYLQTAQGDYPLLGLTDKGVEMMMGELQNPKLDFPSAPLSDISPSKRSSAKGKKAPISAEASENPELLRRLVELRNKMRRQRNVPAYAIFPNAVLISLSNALPTTAQEAMGIGGIGAAKAASVLPAFIDAINEYLKERG